MPKKSFSIDVVQIDQLSKKLKYQMCLHKVEWRLGLVIFLNYIKELRLQDTLVCRSKLAIQCDDLKKYDAHPESWARMGRFIGYFLWPLESISLTYCE